MERLGKIYNLETNNDIRAQVGCVNKKNPQVVYIIGKTWVKLTDDLDTDGFEWNIIRKIKREIASELNNFNTIFNKRYIFDLDFSCDNIIKGKYRFLSYSLYLRQNGDRKFETLLGMLRNISNTLSYNVNKLFTINSFELSSVKKT